MSWRGTCACCGKTFSSKGCNVYCKECHTNMKLGYDEMVRQQHEQEEYDERMKEQGQQELRRAASGR